MLRDGRQSEFGFNEDYIRDSDLFHADAILRLTLFTPFFPGDKSLNDTVDEEDFRLFVQHYGTTENSGFGTGDFIADGTTSLADLIILQNNFGREADSPETNSAAVPEPSSVVLLLLALAFGGMTLLNRLRSSVHLG